ncbi:MAG: hypothetical protein JNJ57_19635 [Saprospiraceae bacterium]|nr:hypothetical protein [Saprospiraceae bacterium]
MITASILALLWNYRKKIPKYVSLALAVGLIIGCTVLLPGRPKKVIELTDGLRVKVYWKAAGLKDTSTLFDVYEPHPWLPFFQQKIGRASDRETNYLDLYPDFTLDIVDDRLIVHHGDLADTLRIY